MQKISQHPEIEISELLEDNVNLISRRFASNVLYITSYL